MAPCYTGAELLGETSNPIATQKHMLDEPSPRRVYVVDDAGQAVGVVTPTDTLRLVSA
jgi:predicted transcriptional regulator